MRSKMMNENGFTLTELMMALSSAMVLVYIIFVAIRVISDQASAASLKMSIETSAREALYRMMMEIRESSPSRITVTSSNQIDFQIPDVTTPVSSEYGVNWGDMIRYTHGGNGNKQIIRTNVTQNTTSVIGNDVTSLTFTGNSAQPTAVTITISVQRALLNGRNVPGSAIDLTGQARIRNT